MVSLSVYKAWLFLHSFSVEHGTCKFEELGCLTSNIIVMTSVCTRVQMQQKSGLWKSLILYKQTSEPCQWPENHICTVTITSLQLKKTSKLATSALMFSLSLSLFPPGTSNQQQATFNSSTSSEPETITIHWSQRNEHLGSGWNSS